MFKSQLSDKQYGPHVKPVRVVVETRVRQYTNKVNRNGVWVYISSTGTEIVKEILIGPDERLAQQPEH